MVVKACKSLDSIWVTVGTDAGSILWIVEKKLSIFWHLILPWLKRSLGVIYLSVDLKAL